MDDAKRATLEQQTRYEPSLVEPVVFARWMEAGAFEPDPDAPGEPFSIAIPPPNVTGALHMGHALNGSIQDALIRLKHMQGRNTRWILGTDHAGIATQNVVEKLLAQEGLSRHDLGRERFVERVWQWRGEYGGIIVGQMQKLGFALDYGHERFTMDDAYAKAVLKAFVELHRRGYLFRANRMINWCTRCHTAISDLEVNHEEVEDRLYEIAYPLEGGGEVVVATVRPVTMLGDTAVAVNPRDERYAGLVGRTAVVPLVERPVPVIADDYVEVGFGTGALKVTPGHDPNDLEIGRRHGLAEIAVIGFDGRMTPDAGERYAGRISTEAEELVVADLEARGLIRGTRPYRHSVGHCDRCGTRVEPLVSLQWFMEMGELAAPAIAAVKERRVRFHPEYGERIFLGWMEAIRPWCVSRQLWWGHQLPIWYCANGHTIVEEQTPQRCPECGNDELERDPDVLDTWFSSALWPYATLGWPEQTRDLAVWFPTDVDMTGREIINLWVARMMMTSLAFLREDPFTDVLVHSIVQAPDGRRMSKSLGTGIDPLDLIETHGADATRYGLLKMSSTQDVRFAEGMLEEGRKLANKLWNASRLILLNAAEVEPEPRVSEPVDAWILSRLDRAVEEMTRLVEAFDLSAATKALYRLVFDDVCDWYLEAAKLRLYGDDEEAKRGVSATLLYVLDRTLRLAHPIIPHVSEELWSYLPPAAGGERGLLFDASWPNVGDAPRDTRSEQAVAAAFDLVVELRRLRNDADLPRSERLTLAIDGGETARSLRAAGGVLHGLANVELDGAGDGQVGVPIAIGDATVRVLGERLAASLRGNVERRLGAARSELERAQQKLANERFVSRARPELVEAERDKAARFAREVAELEQRLASL